MELRTQPYNPQHPRGGEYFKDWDNYFPNSDYRGILHPLLSCYVTPGTINR